MRKIIVTEFITLDGVVEAPGGSETAHPHAGWQMNYGDPAIGKYKANELVAVDGLLLGRHTYEQFASYWPTQKGGDFADRINSLPKYIVSRRLEATQWNNCYLLRDVESDVRELKETEGGDILVYGSATLVRSLLQENLVDELHLLLYPLAIGGGQRIFDEQRQVNRFQLKQSHVFTNGIVLLEYTDA